MHLDCNSKAIPDDMPVTHTIVAVEIRMQMVHRMSITRINSKNNMNSVKYMVGERTLVDGAAATYASVVS